MRQTNKLLTTESIPRVLSLYTLPAWKLQPAGCHPDSWLTSTLDKILWQLSLIFVALVSYYFVSILEEPGTLARWRLTISVRFYEREREWERKGIEIYRMKICLNSVHITLARYDVSMADRLRQQCRMAIPFFFQRAGCRWWIWYTARLSGIKYIGAGFPDSRLSSKRLFLIFWPFLESDSDSRKMVRYSHGGLVTDGG